MLKTLFILLFGLLIFQSASAQRDTMLFYMKYTDELAKSKADADYFRLVISPDTTIDKNLYVVKEYYLNGVPKMVSRSTNRDVQLKLEGTCVTYYHNGTKHATGNYKNGEVLGDAFTYYPNKKLYSYVKFGADKKIRNIECRDSTGKILATGGNGQWINMDDSCKTILDEGIVKDSLAEGEWHGMDSNRVACINIYKGGELISGVYYDKEGGKHPYSALEVEPEFYTNKSGDFGKFLDHTIKYPSDARRNNTQGRVIITFVIEKDGTPTGVTSLRSPSDDLAAEAVRVIKLSRWIPGIQNGHPVRVQFTLPVSFTLGD